MPPVPIYSRSSVVASSTFVPHRAIRTGKLLTDPDVSIVRGLDSKTPNTPSNEYIEIIIRARRAVRTEKFKKLQAKVVYAEAAAG